MQTLGTIAKRYPLILFYLLACIFSWVSWVTPDSIFATSVAVWLPLAAFIVVARGPLAASLSVAALEGGRTAVLTLLQKFIIWRVDWRWYAFALLLAPTIGLMAAYANVRLGAPAPTMMLLTTWPTLLGAFALRLVNPFDGPLQEELGWRGFALPRLQNRFAPFVAYLLLGLLAVGWHLPLVMRGDFPAFALLGTLTQTLVFSWLCNRTRGSVLLPLIAHAADGLIRPDVAGAELVQFWALVTIGWSITALAIVVLDWSRLSRPPRVQVDAMPIPQVAIP